MLEGLDTAVGETDTLVILPAMAGGAPLAPAHPATPGRSWEGSRDSGVYRGDRPRRQREPDASLLDPACWPAVAGFAVALAAGIAGAKTFTLQVAKGAKVTNQSGETKTERIAVTPRGFAGLLRSAATAPPTRSARPRTAASRSGRPSRSRAPAASSKAPGITGKLGTWRRNGFIQLTLNGHPLYRFSVDKHKDDATGEGVHGFGGTWHAVSEGTGHLGVRGDALDGNHDDQHHARRAPARRPPPARTRRTATDLPELRRGRDCCTPRSRSRLASYTS